MAEKLLENLDEISRNRPFEDFEKQWLMKGEELSVNYKDTSFPLNSRKRKLEQLEDSIIVAKRRKLNDEEEKEQAILDKIRRENPERFNRLENKILIKTNVDNSGHTKRRILLSKPVKEEPKYSSPLSSPTPSFQSWMDAVVSDITPSVFNASPPALNMGLFEDLQGSSLRPESDFDLGSNTLENTNQYPLMEEISALNELVNSIQVDLQQSAMLVDYIKNYLKKQELV